jgi:hypothetical protein
MAEHAQASTGRPTNTASKIVAVHEKLFLVTDVVVIIGLDS